MLKPIFIETEELMIHPLRPEDLDRYDELVADIYVILSDEQTLKYIPFKRLSSIQEAELFLQAQMINYHAHRNYIHFITDKKQGKVIGLIDLISPDLAREHYSIHAYPYFIEFYLHGPASGGYVMTRDLPRIIDALTRQGIQGIGAVVNRKNIAAKRVLEKAQFAYKARFDPLRTCTKLYVNFDIFSKKATLSQVR